MTLGSTGPLRTILAFVVGSLAGTAVIVAIFMGFMSAAFPGEPGRLTPMDEIVAVFFRLMASAVPLAAATSLFLGLPAFLLLRRVGGLTPLSCPLVGGLLASVPPTVFMSLRTYAPISSVLFFAAILFVGGAVGGWIFWHIQRPGDAAESENSVTLG
jgi:hypothetical protein